MAVPNPALLTTASDPIATPASPPIPLLVTTLADAPIATEKPFYALEFCPMAIPFPCPSIIAVNASVAPNVKAKAKLIANIVFFIFLFHGIGSHEANLFLLSGSLLITSCLTNQ